MIQYGLIGAGAVSRSFVARLPGIALELGPITAASYRVASRIANSLRAGNAARSVAELNRAKVILFCSDAGRSPELAQLLLDAKIGWQNKALLLCDTELTDAELQDLRAQGASIACVTSINLAGRYVVRGDVDALKAARALVRRMDGHVISVTEDRAALFQAGMTIGTGLLTPLLDRMAQCFRGAGLRDKHAMELAAAVVEKTSRGFAHSGRQSWAWHIRGPERDKLKNQIAAIRERTDFGEEFVRDLMSALRSSEPERFTERELLEELRGKGITAA